MKKILSFLLAFTMLFALCSCDWYYENLYEPPYSAKIVLNGSIKNVGMGQEYCFKDEFIKQNMIKGISYIVGEKIEDGNKQYEYLKDENAPISRAFIVNEQVTYDEIFSESQQIDFEKETYVIYLFPSTTSREQFITDIKLNGETLTVSFATKKAENGHKDSHEPLTRYLVVKMTKLEINKVEFVQA